LWDWHFGPQNTLLRPLEILVAACIGLVLIVCANVANLQLARVAGRRREFSIRLALGSGRGRLSRQLVFESLILSLLGSALGIVIAEWLRGAMYWLLPSVAIPMMLRTPLTWDVFGFAALLAVVAAVAAGVVPALRAARSNINEMLKEGGRGNATGSHSQRLRSILAIGEVALAVVAVVTAAMFQKGFQASRAAAPGFSPEGQVLAQFDLSTAGYNQKAADSFCQRMTEQLKGRPGVTAVSYADTLPLGFRGGNWEPIEVDGYNPAPNENMKIFRNMVGPGYFDVMKIPMVEGRDFDLHDSAQSEPVMIVSQEFARRFILQGSALGRRVHGWGRWFTVVGIVKDIKIHHTEEAESPFFYIPIRQEYRPEYGVTFHVRTSGSVGETIAAVRRAAAAIDPQLTMFDAQSMDEYVAGSLFGQKIAASMLGVLGIVGLLLAAMGLYSLMAYSVVQRTVEIGIRVALGAQPRDVLAMVMRQGMYFAMVGLVVGSAMAATLSRVASALFTGIDTADPRIYFETGSSRFVVGECGTG
jgi:predicted permease